jgi:pimeloyl-ACP methyl ester carboxylesterase
MTHASHQGTRIHYQVEGQGPPLVLQHGFTGKLKQWYSFGYVDALRTDYQLILVDARGHGASDKPHDPAAYALPLRVGDVLSVLDTLKVDKAHYWAGGLDLAWRSMRRDASTRSLSAAPILLDSGCRHLVGPMAPTRRRF